MRRGQGPWVASLARPECPKSRICLPPRVTATSAADKALGLLYDDLRRLARAKVREHQPMTLLDTTSLVHEVCLKLGGR